MGVVAVVFILMVAWLNAAGSDDDSGGPAHTAADAAGAPVQEPAEMAGLNEEVRDGKFAFRVTRVHTSQFAGDTTNQFMTQVAQGEFVQVTIEVANIGDQPQTFFAANQKLVIAGAEYSAHTMGAVYQDSSTVEINPGNAVRVVLPFDVPRGSTPNVIELHDSAFSGGVPVSLN